MLYETALFITPHIENKKIHEVWEEMRKGVEEAGAKTEKELGPILRTLAYPIKKHGETADRAFLGVFYVTPKEEIITFLKNVNEFLKQREEVLRFTIVKHRYLPQAQSKPVRKPVEADGKMADKILTSAQEREKPVKEELDKKLEEILEDKISF